MNFNVWFWKNGSVEREVVLCERCLESSIDEDVEGGIEIRAQSNQSCDECGQDGPDPAFLELKKEVWDELE